MIAPRPSCGDSAHNHVADLMNDRDLVRAVTAGR